MLTIFLYWAIMSFVFLSFGNMLAVLFNKLSRRNESYSFFDTFWLGICIVGGLLLSVSLILPLNIAVLAAFILSSILYWLLNREKGQLLCKALFVKVNSLSTSTKVVLALVVLVVCIHATLTNLSYDFGLYQLQYMMWNESYSVVPGLGNLHGRLGFNSSFLLLSGLFSYHPSYYAPAFPLNALCFLVFFLLAGIQSR